MVSVETTFLNFKVVEKPKGKKKKASVPKEGSQEPAEKEE